MASSSTILKRIFQVLYISFWAIIAIAAAVQGMWGQVLIVAALASGGWFIGVAIAKDSRKRAAAAAEKKRFAEEAAAEAHRQAQLEDERRKAERLADLTARFGAEAAHRVIHRSPKIGDSKAMIIEMLGHPADIDNKETKTKSIETFKYSQVAKNRYGLIFKFENDELTEWEDKR